MDLTKLGWDAERDQQFAPHRANGLIPARVPQPGVRSRWEFGDINHLLARLRKSADELSLPPGSASLGRAVLDFFSWHRGDRLEVFRFSDPAPFFREAIEWIKRR